MNEATKKAVAQLVKQHSDRAGSMNKWGKMHNISNATVSNIVAGKWDGIADKMWSKAAAAVRFQGMEWQAAHTRNFKAIQEWCRVAQRESISMALSFDAGSGKTFSLTHYAHEHANVVYLQCAEYWTKKLFLAHLFRALGKDPSELTGPELAEGIIAELRQRERPLVILDEIDKLRDPLLMYFIELYNKLDGLCGFFLAGAPHLMKAWEKSAKRDKRGFREIYSRVGRKFLHLNNPQRKDVELICVANGVQEEDEVNSVWNAVEREPDLRRVKREIDKIRITKQAA